MKLGFSTWGMPAVEIGQGLEFLAGLGFDGVEITVLPGYTTALEKLEADQRRRIRHLLDQYGLGLPALSAHGSLISQEPQAHAQQWQRLTGAVDLCAEWAGPAGAPVLDTTLGGGPADWDPLRELILERVGELAEYAARRGVTVGLEAHVGSSLDTPEKAVWLVEKIGSAHLRLNFDISHFEVIGIPTAESVAQLAPYAAHTHVKDQRGQEFVVPGEGSFDYVHYLQEMGKAGYNGYVTVEISMVVQRRPDYDPLAVAARSYQVLARAFEGAGIAR